jgi:hypothetical protein
MPSLGTFGAAVREFDPDGERDTFDFFGTTFVVEGVIPPMLMLQLGAAMTGKIGDIEGNAAMWEALRTALTKLGSEPDGDEPFDRFYRLAVDERCSTGELIRLVFSLIGVQAGKAIEQPPDSPDGPQSTSTSSNSSASQSPDSPVDRPVEEVLAG